MKPMSFRNVFASYPKLTAFTIGAIALVFWLAACTVFIVNSQWNDIDSTLNERARLVQSAANAVNKTTLKLVAEGEPSCSNRELGHLRELVFSTEFIGDIGVLDSNGRVACTAVADRLATPVALPTPAMSFVNVVGIPISVYYKLQLLPSEEDTRSTVAVAGKYVIVLNPFMWERISSFRSGNLIRLVLPNGLNIVAAGNEHSISSPALQEILAHLPYESPNIHKFVWSEMAFVSSARIEGIHYFVQKVVTARQFWESYRTLFAGAILVGFVFAFLVFNYAKATFIRWQGIEYRIEGLLTFENTVCVYQPILSLKSQKPVGCEVLVRLKDGDKLIAPDVAIPAIIAKGLTTKLDRLVYAVATRELLSELPSLANFKVAFNFFPETIASGNANHMIFESAENQELRHPGLSMNVEILEQQYQDAVIQEVRKLRANGALISVDDFGTGYSNLGSVKAISPDYLKIDRSFVRDMEDNTVRSTLIPEIAAIARAVNAELVAEGIENESQMIKLAQMGVEYGQGFFICKPTPISGLVAFLSRYA